MAKLQIILVVALLLGVLVDTSFGAKCRKRHYEDEWEHQDDGEDSGEDCEEGGQEGGGGGSGGGYTPPPVSPGNIAGLVGLVGIEYSYGRYNTWSSQITTNSPYLITYPKSSQQVVRVVSWAATSGRNVRVQGYRHSYPPITVGPQDDPAKIVLIDMTRYLTNMSMSSMTIPSRSGLVPSTLNTIVVQAGASMEALMTFAEKNGFGIVMAPIIGGDATVGGVAAIGGHGAAIPAVNERLKGNGYSFGSVSNFIVELKAVVQDPASGRWIEKTFLRWDPEIGAFLVHIGRAVITQYTIMVGKNYHMRCLSRVDIPASELFAHPSNAKSGFRTMAKFIDEVGRVDAIWFPFTDNPWLKLWVVRKTKPSEGRYTSEPYNYQFPLGEVNPQTPGPIFGPQAFRNLMTGLNRDDVWDIYGPSKNTILYYNSSSTPLAYSGWVVLTTRANIQQVLYETTLFYTNLINEFGGQSIYPIDQYIKLRVTGLDDPSETRIPQAHAPLISPLSPVSSRPEWDVGVWMNTLTTTRRAWSDEFMRRFEEWAYQRFNGKDALVRPEWSKNWGHSTNAPFDNPTFLQDTVPKYFGVAEWNQAVNILNKYDPRQVISNNFLRQLMVPYQGQNQTVGVLSADDLDEDYGLDLVGNSGPKQTKKGFRKGFAVNNRKSETAS